MAPVDERNIIRPVGTLAKFNTSRHSLGLIRSVIVICRYNVPLTRLYNARLSSNSSPGTSLPDVLMPLLEHALASVIHDQPILGVGIAGEDTSDPAFVLVEQIDMRRMLEWRELRPPDAAAEGGVQMNGEEEEEEEREKAYENLLLRCLETYHERSWEDLASKPGWKVIVHHDSRQLDIWHSHRAHHEDSTVDSESHSTSLCLSLDISFCFHHGYADGRSAYIFHRDLLRALNYQLNSSTNVHPAVPLLQGHILHISKPPAISPPMEDLIPFTMSWGFILSMVWREVLYPLLKPFFRIIQSKRDGEDRDALPWTGAPIDPSNPKMHIRMVRVGSSDRDLEAILARCRGHNASLTGLIHALASASSSFKPGETMHSLVTSLTVHHDVDAIKALVFQSKKGAREVFEDVEEKEEDQEATAAVWTFAAEMTARLRSRAKTLPRDDILALAGLVGDWHAFMRAKFGKEREATWELSNLGSLSAEDAGFAPISDPDTNTDSDTSSIDADRKTDNRGTWVIDRAIFTQGPLPLGAAMNVNVAGVAPGTGREKGVGNVIITVTWQDGIVETELMDGLAKDLEMWLTEIGKARS
ncbi:hypothetical protein F5Y17DRAFT_473888 [Xylariaceae sp. FL0594]|nr:hypothetical protein F5Y17DRAFT_473888 [Xylariaceae sp. FL0594]